MTDSEIIAPYILENLRLQEQIKNLKNSIASMNAAVKESGRITIKILRAAGLVTHKETLKWSML